jgi:hypothetical protein
MCVFVEEIRTRWEFIVLAGVAGHPEHAHTQRVRARLLAWLPFSNQGELRDQVSLLWSIFIGVVWSSHGSVIDKRMSRSETRHRKKRPFGVRLATPLRHGNPSKRGLKSASTTI